MPAKKVGNELFDVLQKSVAIVGPLPPTAIKGLLGHMNNLEDTLEAYDTLASSLMSSIPTKKSRKEDIDKYVKSRMPSDYVDKRYKKVFLRNLYKVTPKVFKGMEHDEKKSIQASIGALTSFKTLFNVMLALSRSLTNRAIMSTKELNNNSDPRDYEQESTTQRPRTPRSNDQHQNTTQTNVNRKTKNKAPLGKANSPQEYAQVYNKHGMLGQKAVSVLQSNSRELKESLGDANSDVFSLIVKSTQKANELAQAFEAVEAIAKKTMYPGSAAACSSFAKTLTEIGNIVIAGASNNKKTRDKLSKREKQYKEYLDSTTQFQKES